MKKFISVVAFVIASFLVFDSCASAQIGRKKDVVIVYEQLSLDASFKQFKKATKACQLENLNNLMARANEEYYKCKTIEDVYKLRDQLELIKFYNNNADQKSISVTNAIVTLDRKIVDVEAAYKEEKVIHLGGREYYSGRGQD